MKDQILELLRREPGYLSGQEMSNRLGVSPGGRVESRGSPAERGLYHRLRPNQGATG